MAPSRKELTLVATSLIGTPYIWWAKGLINGCYEGGEAVWKARRFLGFDCSGFGAYVLQACLGRDFRRSLSTRSIWSEWPELHYQSDLRPFDAILYGKGTPSHVMWSLGPGVVIGASSGDHTTLIPTNDKCVKTASIDYRNDVLGYRSIGPFVSDP